MTAGSTSQQALRAQKPTLLAFAALIACGALAVPAGAAAFNPQPDPPRQAVINDAQTRFLGGPDTKLAGDVEDRFLGGPDTKLAGP